MRYYLFSKLISITILLAGLTPIDRVLAQSIAPAIDGTNTLVNQSGNEYVITGGNGSSDGINQFHSFSQFSLQAQETAIFPANPALQNILARVTGGDPSLINGLIRVTGGHPNLWLINPSGIVFGAQASLNVPGSFTATTANGVGLGNQWFNAIGRNDYGALTGQPNSFAFTMAQPGAIVNLGHLSVQPQQTLALLGGTVMGGTLAAPGGQIIVAAVPGGNWVRLSQADSPLSLEIQPLHPLVRPNDWLLPIATLPQLLTGGTLSNANQITINASGQVELAGSGLKLEAGDITVNALTADNAILNARNITLWESQLQTSQNLTLLAKDTVRLRDSQRNPFLAKAGGNLWIQGDQLVDILALNHLAAGIPLQSGGNLTLVSNGIVSGDAHFKSGKNFAILNLNGQGGKFVSLFDPIIYAQGDFSLAAYSGVALKVQTEGNITLGDVTITGPDRRLERQILGNPTIPAVDPDIALLSTQTALILQSSNGSINVGNILAPPNFEGDQGAAVVLTAAGNITTGSINTALNQVNTLNLPVRGGLVTLVAGGDVKVGGAIDTFFLGNNANHSTGGNVSINAGGSIQLLGAINTSANNSFNASPLQNLVSQGGNVTLKAGTPGTFDHTIGFAGYINAAGAATDPLNQGIQGVGGEVKILAYGPIRGLGRLGGNTIDASGATSRFGATAGSLPGKVLIQQEGGPQNLDFIVSDRSVIANGLAGNITTGVDVVNSQRFSAGETVNVGNTILIRLLSNSPTLTLTPPTNFFPIEEPIRSTILLPNDEFGVALRDRGVSVGISLGRPEQVLIGRSCVAAQCSDGLTRSPGGRVDLPPGREPKLLKPGRPPALEGLVPAAIGLLPNQIASPEDIISREFGDYFGLPKAPTKSIGDQQQIVRDIEQRTKLKPAFIYLNFVVRAAQPSDQDPLEILIITGKGEPIRRPVPTATRGQVIAMAKQLRNEVADPLKTVGTSYLKPAQQLYRWLIAPVADDLAVRQINNLVFLTDVGLRSLPFAVMHDGHHFLLENYSLGLMPSVSLTDMSSSTVNHSQILGVGISEATQDQPSLPGVLTEILMLQQQWSGKILLNQTATLANLKATRRQHSYNIVHVATHAAFPAGDRASAYIQLWDGKLRLADIRKLGWNEPPVELLVLSACSTAVGDRDAELGFAGMALQTGVKSVVASLWQVNDIATTALISRFYMALKATPIKAVALQQAQLAMLRGELTIVDDHIVEGLSNANQSADPTDNRMAHPYYWSAFTLVGNPW